MTRRSALRHLGAALTGVAVLGTLGLQGCSTLGQLSTEVSSHGQWPVTLKTPRYAFERLPSQQAQAEQQARVEAAAEPELAARGFVKVASADQADVLVQVAMQTRLISSYRDDPYYRPYDGRLFGNVSIGGMWGGRSGIGLGLNFDAPRSVMQVSVLMRDRRAGQIVYETSASHQQAGMASESLMPLLFRAALMDFPAPGISPRRVLVDTSTPSK